jgi:hypothetical protein
MKSSPIFKKIDEIYPLCGKINQIILREEKSEMYVNLLSILHRTEQKTAQMDRNEQLEVNIIFGHFEYSSQYVKT